MSDWTPWESVEGYEFVELLYEKRYRLRNGERCGGVARIRFNRPERMNAFTLETSAQLIEALNEANRDRSIGVIVLSHTGQHFGVGGDVAGLGAMLRTYLARDREAAKAGPAMQALLQGVGCTPS